mmetsp:Transcript_30922/g.75415  ORF Transcript_30922/g.75415 Transcript_30922/m.75415 type:complete len:92 (+) Transcript_30922:126-401(+)
MEQKNSVISISTTPRIHITTNKAMSIKSIIMYNEGIIFLKLMVLNCTRNDIRTFHCKHVRYNFFSQGVLSSSSSSLSSSRSGKDIYSSFST